jgi:hypothetical protein
MDILGKRPNLLFLIAIRDKIDDIDDNTNLTIPPNNCYRNLLCTQLRRDIYWIKWKIISKPYELKNLLTYAKCINILIPHNQRLKYSN